MPGKPLSSASNMDIIATIVLPLPYIALQKTIHLLARACIIPYLFQYPFLCIGKLER